VLTYQVFCIENEWMTAIIKLLCSYCPGAIIACNVFLHFHSQQLGIPYEPTQVNLYGSIKSFLRLEEFETINKYILPSQKFISMFLF